MIEDHIVIDEILLMIDNVNIGDQGDHQRDHQEDHQKDDEDHQDHDHQEDLESRQEIDNHQDIHQITVKAVHRIIENLPLQQKKKIEIKIKIKRRNNHQKILKNRNHLKK